MKNEFIIGCDPGANGGIAVYDTARDKVMAVKMPDTPMDVFNTLAEFKDNSICYLEKVGGMPGQGGMSMFNFGKGFGHLEMALLALGIPTVEVTPQKWQRHFQLGSSKACASKTEWKNKLKARAQQLYPTIKVTLSIADALLIMNYGTYNERGR